MHTDVHTQANVYKLTDLHNYSYMHCVLVPISVTICVEIGISLPKSFRMVLNGLESFTYLNNVGGGGVVHGFLSYI